VAAFGKAASSANLDNCKTCLH